MLPLQRRQSRLSKPQKSTPTPCQVSGRREERNERQWTVNQVNNNRPLLHHEWKSGLFAKGSERKDADAKCVDADGDGDGDACAYVWMWMCVCVDHFYAWQRSEGQKREEEVEEREKETSERIRKRQELDD